jgi:hypothetical protein
MKLTSREVLWYYGALTICCGRESTVLWERKVVLIHVFHRGFLLSLTYQPIMAGRTLYDIEDNSNLGISNENVSDIIFCYHGLMQVMLIPVLQQTMTDCS